MTTALAPPSLFNIHDGVNGINMNIQNGGNSGSPTNEILLKNDADNTPTDTSSCNQIDESDLTRSSSLLPQSSQNQENNSNPMHGKYLNFQY